MIRPLALHENPDEMAKALSETLGRPVFVCAAFLIQRPGWSALQFFLSKLEMDKEGGPVPASTLHLVIPVLPHEQGSWDAEFKSFNLQSGLDSICITSKEQAEEMGLLPYWQTFLKGKPRSYSGIKFRKSIPFLNPKESFDQWHKDPASTKDMTILRPPGQYFGSSPALDDHNRFLLVTRAPGACIACRGLEMQEQHFAIASNWHSHVEAHSLVCLNCLPKLMQFIQNATCNG